MFRWVWRLGLSALALAVGFMAFIGVYGQADTAAYDEDAAIVFGAGLIGSEPTVSLRRRLEAALVYADKNPGAVIVVTGGQGPNEVMPEAEAMALWLIRNGVAPGRLLVENRSVDTRTNIEYAKQMLDGLFQRPYRVALITNDFHLFRAGRYARAYGLSVTRLGAPAPMPAALMWYPRECVAFLKYIVFLVRGV